MCEQIIFFLIYFIKICLIYHFLSIIIINNDYDYKEIIFHQLSNKLESMFIFTIQNKF